MVTTTYSFRTEDQDMITEFEDFCTWVVVGVDDIWEQIAPFFKRPGPAPVCSDSELIAMALIGECRGWHRETERLRCGKAYRAMFHHIPSQSRFAPAPTERDASFQLDPAGSSTQPGLE